MGRKATYDPKEIAEFCKSNTWQAAAKKFGCSRSTIENACDAHGVIPNKKLGKLASIAEWVRENNATASEAAIKFGRDRGSINAACKTYGVNPCKEREPVQPVLASNFEVLRLLIEGMSDSDIAREMGVSRQRIGQIKERAVSANLFGKNSIIQLKTRPPTY